MKGFFSDINCAKCGASAEGDDGVLANCAEQGFLPRFNGLRAQRGIPIAAAKMSFSFVQSAADLPS